ncbi:MAG: hypothetical protein LBC72_04425 [Spirochaetaceae bacterium]|nr:hypothetical protein [Spirochaetaceae bacterium]
MSLFQNRLFCNRLLQFFGLGPAKLRFFKVAVPKTEVLEQPPFVIFCHNFKPPLTKVPVFCGKNKAGKAAESGGLYKMAACPKCCALWAQRIEVEILFAQQKDWNG